MKSYKFEENYISQGYNNNRCSEYTLAHILMEIYKLQLQSATDDDTVVLGNWTYSHLCSCQKRLLAGCTRQNVSLKFIKSPLHISNGTCMILTSSIVAYCHKLKLRPKIIYSTKRDSIFGKEVFEDDCTRMKKFLCPVKDYAEIEEQVTQYRYLMALTRFKHWVSLKATEKGYYLYDPAPEEFQGGVFGPGSFHDLLPEINQRTGNKFFYGVVIGISPKK